MARPLVLGICVGGRGTRMGGVQKALLIAPDTGETLVARSIRLGREAGHEVVLLGAAELGAEVAGAPQLPDAEAGIGPLAGLQSLLAYAGERDALCLACDMPFVSAALLARLTNETHTELAYERARLAQSSDTAATAESAVSINTPNGALKESGAAQVSAPRRDLETGKTTTPNSGVIHVVAPRDLETGKWQPLFARYHSSAVAPLLERALAEGERSFQGLFKRLTIRELPLDESERAQLRDWDTPEDMRAPSRHT